MVAAKPRPPQAFGDEVDRLIAEGRWTPHEFRRISAEIVAEYGLNSGLRDALAEMADPSWHDQVIFEVVTNSVG